MRNQFFYFFASTSLAIILSFLYNSFLIKANWFSSFFACVTFHSCLQVLRGFYYYIYWFHSFLSDWLNVFCKWRYLSQNNITNDETANLLWEQEFHVQQLLLQNENWQNAQQRGPKGDLRSVCLCFCFWSFEKTGWWLI
jgi:hypothetical protein